MKKLTKKKKMILSIFVLLIVIVGIFGAYRWASSDSNLVFKGKQKNVMKQEDERKNTYVIGVTQLPTKRLTFLQTMDGSKVVNELVYPALAAYEKGEYQYILAQSIIFTENGKKASITLDTETHKFSDGCPLTADDIIYSYHFFNCSDTGYENAEDYLCIKGAYEYQIGKRDSIEGIQKVSDSELTIEFTESSYVNLQIFELPIIHSANHDAETMNLQETYLGCGDYQIEYHSIQQSLQLATNPYTKEKASYEKIDIVPADIRRLENQEIDTMVIHSSALESVKALESYDIYCQMSSERDFIVFNPENEAMSSASLRKEMVGWIDTEQLVEENYDSGLRSKGILHGDKDEPNFISMDKNVYSRKTKNIIFQCSYMSNEMQLANAVSEQLAKGEIKVEMRNVDENTPQMDDSEVSMYYYFGEVEDLLNVWDLSGFVVQMNEHGLDAMGDLLEQYLLEQMYAIPLHNEVYYKINLCGRKEIEVFEQVY